MSAAVTWSACGLISGASGWIKFKSGYAENHALVEAMRRHPYPVNLRIREGNQEWITYSELDHYLGNP